MFGELGEAIAMVQVRLSALDRRLAHQHRTNPLSQQLAKVPGIGPIAALSLALSVEPSQFKSGRHFAAWLGLTPMEK